MIDGTTSIDHCEENCIKMDWCSNFYVDDKNDRCFIAAKGCTQIKEYKEWTSYQLGKKFYKNPVNPMKSHLNVKHCYDSYEIPTEYLECQLE